MQYKPYYSYIHWFFSGCLFLLLWQDSLIGNLPILPIAGISLIVFSSLPSIGAPLSICSLLLLSQYLLSTIYEVVFNSNYDVAFLFPLNVLIILFTNSVLTSTAKTRLWSSIISTIIWSVVLLFFLQVFVWFIFGYYIDYASFFGSTASRYISSKGVVFMGTRMPRFTGIYDEPSNLAANLLLLVVTLLSINKFDNKFRRLAIVASIVSALTTSWLGYLLSVLLLLVTFTGSSFNIPAIFSQVKSKVSLKKLSIFVSAFTISLLAVGFIFFMGNFLLSSSVDSYDISSGIDYRVNSFISYINPTSIIFGMPRSLNPGTLYDDLGFLVSMLKNFGLIFTVPLSTVFLVTALKSLPSIILISLLKIKLFYPLSVFCLSLTFNSLFILHRK